MSIAEDQTSELSRLRGVAREYNVTIRVLAVVVELLLAQVGGDSIMIEDKTLDDAPDLRAWRIPEDEAVAIAIERPQ